MKKVTCVSFVSSDEQQIEEIEETEQRGEDIHLPPLVVKNTNITSAHMSDYEPHMVRYSPQAPVATQSCHSGQIVPHPPAAPRTPRPPRTPVQRSPLQGTAVQNSKNRNDGQIGRNPRQHTPRPPKTPAPRPPSGTPVPTEPRSGEWSQQSATRYRLRQSSAHKPSRRTPVPSGRKGNAGEEVPHPPTAKSVPRPPPTPAPRHSQETLQTPVPPGHIEPHPPQVPRPPQSRSNQGPPHPVTTVPQGTQVAMFVQNSDGELVLLLPKPQEINLDLPVMQPRPPATKLTHPNHPGSSMGRARTARVRNGRILRAPSRSDQAQGL